MRKRILGKTGISVSEIGFGAWAIGASGWGAQDENDSLNALFTAIDHGVNFIDTAAGYGNGKSEQVIAKALKDRKEKITIATKIHPVEGVWPPSPYCKVEERYPEKYLREKLEDRLRFLNTDCIDLLQLHTWTRAWNENPEPFQILRKFKEEGKIKHIGVSTPEQDQNAVIDLMKNGWVDTVQLIYNIFEQEPAAELLPTAKKYNVGVIVRVAFDEGVLTGKYNSDFNFGDDDFRSNYFAGDRLERSVKRVEKIKEEFAGLDISMPQLALKFPLSHPAVSTVIAGMRNDFQAKANASVSDLPDLSEDILTKLRKHAWLRGNWYGGK